MKQRQAGLVLLVMVAAALASAWFRPAAACGDKCHFNEGQYWECVYSIILIECYMDITNGDCLDLGCAGSPSRSASSSLTPGGVFGTPLGLDCSSRPAATLTASARLDAPVHVVRLKGRT